MPTAPAKSNSLPTTNSHMHLRSRQTAKLLSISPPMACTPCQSTVRRIQRRLDHSFATSVSVPMGNASFIQTETSPDHELFIANPDGTVKSQITTSDHGCFHPVFDNSGDRVFFLMEEWPQGLTGVPKSSIWTVKGDGTEQKQITDLSLFDAPLKWKPPRAM